MNLLSWFIDEWFSKFPIFGWNYDSMSEIYYDMVYKFSKINT